MSMNVAFRVAEVNSHYVVSYLFSEVFVSCDAAMQFVSLRVSDRISISGWESCGLVGNPWVMVEFEQCGVSSSVAVKLVAAVVSPRGRKSWFALVSCPLIG